jgi:hypothetical protein
VKLLRNAYLACFIGVMWVRGLTCDFAGVLGGIKLQVIDCEMVRLECEENHRQLQTQVLRLRGSLARTTSFRMTVFEGRMAEEQAAAKAKTEADPCGMTSKKGNGKGNSKGNSKYRDSSLRSE